MDAFLDFYQKLLGTSAPIKNVEASIIARGKIRYYIKRQRQHTKIVAIGPKSRCSRPIATVLNHCIWRRCNRPSATTFGAYCNDYHKAVAIDVKSCCVIYKVYCNASISIATPFDSYCNDPNIYIVSYFGFYSNASLYITTLSYSYCNASLYITTLSYSYWNAFMTEFFLNPS